MIRTLLIANPKGGSGKTTLAVNLASLLAARGDNVRLLDLDRQQSARRWLAGRPASLPPIWPYQPGQSQGSQTGWLIIDSAAGLHGKMLSRMLKLARQVIVPIAPSAFDISASQEFLQALGEEKAIRKEKTLAGAVGMRVTPRTRAARQLEEWLQQQSLPLITHLQDSQHYINAGFEGRGIADLPARATDRLREPWLALLNWIDQQAPVDKLPEELTEYL